MMPFMRDSSLIHVYEIVPRLESSALKTICPGVVTDQHRAPSGKFALRGPGANDLPGLFQGSMR